MKPLKIGTIVAATAAAVAAAAILLKDRLLPEAEPAGAPQPAAETAPPAETTPAPTEAPETTDLTSVKGIGPVYRTRLNEIGITTFSDLADADAATVAAEIDVPEPRVADWIGQAAQFVGH